MSSRQQIRERMVSRKLALQALYQWQISGEAITEIEAQFSDDDDFAKADEAYFHRLMAACTTPKHNLALQSAVEVMEYPLERVDPVEAAILRIAIYELSSVPEMDRAIVIQEAVRLAKKFGDANSYRFINKVLDQLP